MKSVLLLAVNARFSHTNLALYYLKTVLENASIPAVIKEYNINQDFLEVLYDIARQDPQIICISFYIWNAEYLKSIVPDLKKILPEVRLIAGGPEISYNPEKWLKILPEINHIVCGNGESEIVSLIKEADRPAVIHSKAIDINDVDFPYYKLEVEEKNQRYFYYESSRGCPFKCAYCLSSRVDQKLQFRALDKVFEELCWFMNNDFKHIKFVDRTFNADMPRARRIWQFLIEYKTANPQVITDFHFEVHPGLLKEDDLRILRCAPRGFFRFEIGIQTLHEPTLMIINRKMDWEQVKGNFLKLHKPGNINIHLDLIAGLPAEDFETFGRSFDLVFQLKPDHLQLGFLKILPGTEMEQTAEKYGMKWQQDPPYQILRTDDLSFIELSKIIVIEKLLEMYYNSHNFETFFRLNPGISWDFFSEFAEYCMQKEINLMIRKWEKLAQLLHEFCERSVQEKIEYIRDCLRFDFCKKSRGHIFPAFLFHRSLDEAYKAGYDHIHNRQNAEDQPIKPKDARSAIYFKPVSEDFPQSDMLHVFIGLPAHKKHIMISWEEVTSLV